VGVWSGLGVWSGMGWRCRLALVWGSGLRGVGLRGLTTPTLGFTSGVVGLGVSAGGLGVWRSGWSGV